MVMSGERVLVVYYSRSGSTRTVAEALAGALGADLEPIQDEVDRRGVWGYLRSGTEASLGASTEIRRGSHDPSRYDLVVIGSPVWRLSVSTPVRTYLWLERPRLPRVAFFVTLGGMGSGRALRQMGEVAAKQPAATLALRERDLGGRAWRGQVERFAASLLRALARRPAPRHRAAPGRRGARRAHPRRAA